MDLWVGWGKELPLSHTSKKLVQLCTTLKHSKNCSQGFWSKLKRCDSENHKVQFPDLTPEFQFVHESQLWVFDDWSFQWKFSQCAMCMRCPIKYHRVASFLGNLAQYSRRVWLGNRFANLVDRDVQAAERWVDASCRISPSAWEIHPTGFLGVPSCLYPPTGAHTLSSHKAQSLTSS